MIIKTKFDLGGKAYVVIREKEIREIEIYDIYLSEYLSEKTPKIVKIVYNTNLGQFNEERLATTKEELKKKLIADFTEEINKQ
jgi:hypothetical protein